MKRSSTIIITLIMVFFPSFHSHASSSKNPSYEVTISFIKERSDFKKRHTKRHELCPGDRWDEKAQTVNFNGSKMTVEREEAAYAPGCYVKFSNSKFHSMHHSSKGSYTIDMSEVKSIKVVENAFPFDMLKVEMKKNASISTRGDKFVNDKNVFYFYVKNEPNRVLKALRHLCILCNANLSNDDDLFK